YKRKHDSDDDEDDDDDEGPSAGSNQGFCLQVLLGQLNLLLKMMSKVRRNHKILMHLRPNNIQLLPQLAGKSLTQEMLLLTLRCTDLNPNLDILNIPLMTFQNKMKAMSQIWRTLITLIFPRRTGKKKLCKADLEGPAFNLVKAFHKNNVFLQF
ncbi:hypothetical protein Tco_1364199, partial [Tanacetum coccineum]